MNFSQTKFTTFANMAAYFVQTINYSLLDILVRLVSPFLKLLINYSEGTFNLM